jgi:two-component system, cell cycle sensor histidine kinase and response regulator CckA
MPEMHGGRLLANTYENRSEMRASRTIMVVEDDEETLNIVARTLAAADYDVLWARNGDDTLTVLNRHGSAIALMVVDVVLPGMTGPELVDTVKRKYPETGAIYVSAFDLEAVRSHGVDPDTMPFLAKPYEPEELLHTVEKVLGEGTGAGRRAPSG